MSRITVSLFVPLLLATASAFSPLPADTIARLGVRLYAEDETTWESAFPSADIIDISLPEHKPLGCTVEESLGDNDLKPVFVSKVVAGGNAEKAGIKVGDVIVGVTGIFGGLQGVLGKGIEEVTQAVAGRAGDEVLDFRIARGTAVINEHETALVDLCASVGANDKEIEECVVNFLTSTYAEEDEDPDPVEPCDDDDDDCILDNLFENIWEEEFQESAAQKEADEVKKEVSVPKAKKPLPWRSRSSPSGTFVRDPKTGEMKNIDA